MEHSFMEDEEAINLYQKARELYHKGNYIKALEILEDMILVNSQDSNIWVLHHQQGNMYVRLATRSENPDLEFAYWLASVGCFSKDLKSSGLCAQSLQKMAKMLGSKLLYKKALAKAKQGLSVAQMSFPNQEVIFVTSKELEMLIKDVEIEIADSKTGGPTKGLERLIKDSEMKIADSKTGGSSKGLEMKIAGKGLEMLIIADSKTGGSSKRLESLLKERESKKSQIENDEIKGLRSYWVRFNDATRRDFMKVSIEKLTSFVEGVHHKEGRDLLEQVLTSAKEDKKWKFWACRSICSKRFSSAEDCKKHFEKEHNADFKPSSGKNMVQRIGKDWTRKILVGSWEPVNAEAAVKMIKTRLADVKEFVSKSKNGWSREWPVVVDEERSKLLMDIKSLLVSFCDLKILSSSIRDWVMSFPLIYLEKFEVSETGLTDSRLVDTPQSICFLACHELNQILDFLKSIKFKRDDGTDVVCRAVDSFLVSSHVKERIDFDPEFSLLLLDRRLLNCSIPPVDDEGLVNVFDPDVHYAKARAQGDDIVSWLVDYGSVDKSFPRPVREYNLEIWVAVLRAIQFTCRNLETKYAKKEQFLQYGATLTGIEILCSSEDEKRSILQEDQWNGYASLLWDSCEERALRNTLTEKSFLCAVRDILEGASHPTFDFPNLEDCLNHIRERKSLADDKVLKSIELLKSVVFRKILLIDSKILLIDNSRISLLNNLTKLSLFDNRSYVLQMLKPFLLSEMRNMLSKIKSDAAEAAKAALLIEEEKTKSKLKKKKNKTKKEASTSMSSPRDKAVEQSSEPSVNLEPESTSQSSKMVEEDSMETKDTKVDPCDMQNIRGEDSKSVHLESALGEIAGRYNSALDMTLKALLSITVLKEDLILNEEPFHENQQEQVPCALQNLFNAFSSDVITGDGIYSCLLRDILASLEVVHPLSSDAAEVLVAILEFWHCWKSRERESLVTRLFTWEENISISCRKCRRKSNFQEQSSYGIVMAASSIRDLKSAFGDIKFVDILKMIRMDYRMLCDTKTGGCGKTNFVHHIISRCPLVFIIVLEWEKSETKKEIYETTKALDCEIDISRLYEGLKPNTNYRLVSMVGCGEEEGEHICMAYVENQWVSLRPDTFAAEEVVGNWERVVSFCEERKLRPTILCYETAGFMT